MKALKPFGRILFGFPFIVFGLLHIISAGNISGQVPTYIPGGVIWILITGAVFILVAISILTRRYAAAACLILGIMLVIFILTIHLPAVGRAGISSASFSSLLKDLALAGASFFLSGHYYSRIGGRY